MIANCYTATGTGYSRYKLGGKFVAAKTRIGTDTETYGWYSYELDGWLKGMPSADTRTVEADETVYSESACTTTLGTVSKATNFCLVSVSSVGAGTCGVATELYGGRYVTQGTIVTFTPTHSTDRMVMSFKVNGSEIEGPPYSIEASTDLVAVVTFCPTSYSLKHEIPIDGTSVVTVGGTIVEPGDTKSGVDAGEAVVVTATADTGKVFLYTEVDGRRYVENPLTFQIHDRPSDEIFNVKAVFGGIASVTDTISVDGSGSVVVKHGDTVVYLDADGKFNASVGAIYTIIATPDAGKSVDGFYENGRLVARGSTYTLVQDTASRTVLVKFSAERSIVVNLFVGPDISSQIDPDPEGDGWNGCTCGVITPTGSTVGTYVFSPNAADGYHFVRLYIGDRDGTGKGRVIPAGGSYSVFLDFNALVVAIFADNDTPVEPTDEDQGHPSAKSPTSAILKEWEGSEARMTATWRSRRNVYGKPVSFSSARVYANGYSNWSPKLTVSTYASPATSDGNELCVVVGSQDAFRLPKKRPEKYVEIEVASNARILEFAVSTSMGGLCQESS